jgi:RNA polymerase sigma factor (sigma-70 family)
MNETNQIQDLIPTRRTLLSRLKDWNDHENWRVFFDTYWKLIYRAAIQGGLTHTEAQDAVQETVISVMKNIPGFHYDARRGSFKTWLLQLTRWRVIDQLRKRDTGFHLEPGRPATSTGMAATERTVNPWIELEAVWEREWETNLLEAAVERVKRKADPKQYQIFNLAVFKQWPVSKVARHLEISAARVYLAKHRIGKLVRKEVASLRDKPI